MATLGLAEGSYPWTWGTHGFNGSTADFLTIKIGSVPAFGAFALLGMGMITTTPRKQRRWE